MNIERERERHQYFNNTGLIKLINNNYVRGDMQQDMYCMRDQYNT